MGHLKLKDGTTFPLNLSVGDIRDISKRSGAFSKTITLVGDDDNNNLLNHYYDVNVIAGTFDVNKLQQCQVIQNGIVILDNAYMQLVEVVKSQTTDAHNQQIEYKVLVKDSVSDFFTKLGNKTLNDINMNEIVLGGTPLTYTSANVVSSFSNTITDGYKFVLPFDAAVAFTLRAMHPALYAKTYFDAIFQGAGFTYEWGNQSPSVHTTNDNYFEKLLIPYNGGTPQQDRNDYLVEATKAYTPTTSGLSWTSQVTGFTEVTDAENIFDPTNGDYAVPFYIQNPENIEVQVTLNYDIDAVNNSGSLATRSGTTTGLFQLRAKEQGVSNTAIAIVESFTFPATIAGSTTTNITTGATKTVTMNLANLSNTDIMELYMSSAASGTSYDQSVDLDITINSSTWKIIPSSDTIGYQSELNLNIYVPKKIKQSDFIKSIFMMYNLYAEVDSSQPNKLILQHRDEYYDSGAEIDWTDKLAKDKEQTLQFLPELSAKKMVLSYKDDKDDINEIYKEATNETYGQVEYTFENEYVKGIDRKEIIFSPTPIVKTLFNAYVPALSYIPETNVRILIDGGTQTCDQYSIIDVNGSIQTDTTTAPLITHFDDPLTPSFDLNFAVCDYYFYSNLSTKTNNNLYNLYWRRTLGQIDKGKMLSAYFDLNEVDIQSLKLNDKIRIDNSWWHINKVIDYDANERKLTKVELISVDEEVEFTPFATTPTIPSNPIQPPVRPVRPVRPTRPETFRPVKDILKKNNEAKNLLKGDVDVKGYNNTIGSDVTKAIVVGDDINVEEDGIHTEKLFINGTEIDPSTVTDNFANANLTLDGNRTHDLDSNVVDFVNGATDLVNIDRFGLTVNDGQSTNVDLHAKGGTDANLFFVDANGDKVGVGTNTPSKKLDINGDGRFDSGVIINDGANNSDTRIEGQTDANLFFVDASTDRVGIGTNTPGVKLDVSSTGAGMYIGDGTFTDHWFNIRGNETTGISIGLNDSFNGGSGGALIKAGNSKNFAVKVDESNSFNTVTESSCQFLIDVNGNQVLGSQSALATTATNGFTYIPTCAGTPTGTPTAYTGKVPMVYDTTNSIMYVYTGGAWTAV